MLWLYYKPYKCLNYSWLHLIKLASLNAEEISIILCSQTILCFGHWCLQNEIMVYWSPLGFLTTKLMNKCLNLLDYLANKKLKRIFLHYSTQPGASTPLGCWENHKLLLQFSRLCYFHQWDHFKEIFEAKLISLMQYIVSVGLMNRSNLLLSQNIWWVGNDYG